MKPIETSYVDQSAYAFGAAFVSVNTNEHFDIMKPML